jgi:tetratricopeptide (TPR) repeat protein
MKKQHPSSSSSSPTIPPQPLSLADHLEEHHVVQWLSKHGLTLIYFLLGAFFLFLLWYRFLGGNYHSEQNFYEAESSLIKLQNDPQDSQAALEKLRALLKAHPELHASYDGLIAQALLNEGDVKEATAYAEPTIERTKSENAPFFTDFAQTSLLIADKKYSEALQQAQALNKKIHDEQGARQENTLLFAYNLLRIGMLQQELGKTEEANQTWHEWMGYAQKTNENMTSKRLGDGFLLLQRIFSDGKLSLLNYIAHQENLQNEK